LGGGLPISAITGRAELMDGVHPGGLGGTYGGNPVAAAAALAVLDVIERGGLLERSRRIGERIRERFTAMAATHELIGDVRGRGAMNAMELVTDRTTKAPADAATAQIATRCLEQGVIVLAAGTYGNVIRLLPPLTIDDALLEDGLDVLDDVIAGVAG
jgi:4-aminobutyrate aminotransferase/(S)-3-amino-2-methylpropionate transaminase